MPRSCPGGGWAQLELTDALADVRTREKEQARLPVLIQVTCKMPTFLLPWFPVVRKTRWEVCGLCAYKDFKLQIDMEWGFINCWRRNNE